MIFRDIRTSEVRSWIKLQPLLRTCYHLFKSSQSQLNPINPETAAKHCFASGNEEKETPGRPRFDIISRWNIGRIAWIGIPVLSVESADCRPGAKCIQLQTADCQLDTKRRLRIKTFFIKYVPFYDLPSVTQSLFRGHLGLLFLSKAGE